MIGAQYPIKHLIQFYSCFYLLSVHLTRSVSTCLHHRRSPTSSTLYLSCRPTISNLIPCVTLIVLLRVHLTYRMPEIDWHANITSLVFTQILLYILLQRVTLGIWGTSVTIYKQYHISYCINSDHSR